MLPFAYAIRNLWRRRARTSITLLGIAAIVVLVVLLSGFARALTATTEQTAAADVAILTGTTGENDLVRSVISLSAARQLATNLPAVLEVEGERAVSIELHIATRRDDQIGLLRGVEPSVFLVRPRVTVVNGLEPRGPWELMVGRLAESRMGLPEGALDVGRTIQLEDRPWKVVGRFAAPGTTLEAEMWGRLDDVMTSTRRTDVSCVAARLESPQAFEDLEAWVVRHGVTYEAVAVRETALYDGLKRALTPIAGLVWVMAFLVLVGGVFASTNTMFAAVLARNREMGALRAIGYGPVAVGLSLLQESILLGLLGGILGFLASGLFRDLPLKFPMGAFYLDVTPSVRLWGLGAALLIGLLGGIVPALRAIRMPLTDALGDRL